ncbi:MAG TPA: hypothetical protein VFJ05_01670 [Nitrososphaeraceae archaeon]|nr:hypothetical protein [Nitrososphaeraceae archaeon]
MDTANQYANFATQGTDSTPILNNIGTIHGWMKSNESILSGKSICDPFGQILKQDGNSLAAFGFAG